VEGRRQVRQGGWGGKGEGRWMGYEGDVGGGGRGVYPGAPTW